MRLRASILLAVLVVLCTPAQGHAEPGALPLEKTSSLPGATAASVSSKPSLFCSQNEWPMSTTASGLASSRLCLFNYVSIEEKAAEFRQAQIRAHERLLWRQARERRERAAQRRAERRAAEARLAKYVSESEATVPRIAPRAVKATVEAGNAIATTPYVWGGGHGSFESSGYDCSGAVSYALHGGGLLEAPLDSSGLSAWGEPGPGKWITVYANSGHAWMTIAGLTFDTSGGGDGPRWHPSMVNSPEGYAVRHPAGY